MRTLRHVGMLVWMILSVAAGCASADMLYTANGRWPYTRGPTNDCAMGGIGPVSIINGYTQVTQMNVTLSGLGNQNGFTGPCTTTAELTVFYSPSGGVLFDDAVASVHAYGPASNSVFPDSIRVNGTEFGNPYTAVFVNGAADSAFFGQRTYDFYLWRDCCPPPVQPSGAQPAFENGLPLPAAAIRSGTPLRNNLGGNEDNAVSVDADALRKRMLAVVRER